MRVLYCPIIEPGSKHETALRNKRGLLDALVEAGHSVVQWDYLDTPNEWQNQTLVGLVDEQVPDLLLMQLHGANCISAQTLAGLRVKYPNMKVVNWSGDHWRHSLTAEPMIELCRQFDLQLCAAPDVLPDYAEKGIKARFWQIAYEKPVGALPDVPAYDVVFLGNVISEPRREMLKMLRTLPYKVGIYGDWEGSDGDCTYDFGYGEALYKNAKLAIADSAYPEDQNYISNRPIQVMMAHGALLLHQRVPKMAELSNGWESSVHFEEWDDLVGLQRQIDMLMKIHPTDMDILGVREWRDKVVNSAYQHASTHHTYKQRVEQLMGWLDESR